jgi:hypothetical protein
MFGDGLRHWRKQQDRGQPDLIAAKPAYKSFPQTPVEARHARATGNPSAKEKHRLRSENPIADVAH